MPTLHKPLRSLVFLLAMLSAGTAWAQETTWYDVEIIVFAQNAPPLESEAWPEEPGLPSLEDALDLFSDRQPAPAAPFRPLGAETHRLKEALAKLEKSRHFHPLVHVAWRQPGLPREKAVAVRIEKEFPGEPAKAPASTAEADLESIADTMGFGLRDEPVHPRLDGTLRLVLSRYLHLEADLVYSLPSKLPEDESASIDSEAAWLQGYRLQESRRMRSREIHYFDHPVFGIIALVTPAQPDPALR